MAQTYIKRGTWPAPPQVSSSSTPETIFQHERINHQNTVNVNNNNNAAAAAAASTAASGQKKGVHCAAAVSGSQTFVHWLYNALVNTHKAREDKIHGNWIKDSRIETSTVPFSDQYQRLKRSRRDLPVSRSQVDIVRTVSTNRVVIITAETGSGNSTQIPTYLLQRLVSRSELRRSLMWVACGGLEVGYQIKGEKCLGMNGTYSRLRFATEGSLLGRLLNMRERGTGYHMATHIILDEAHERTAETDLLLGFLRLLMGANLWHDILPAREDTSLARTIIQIHESKPPGDILVFVPGLQEINKTIDALSRAQMRAQHRPELYALHSTTPRAQQQEAPPPVIQLSRDAQQQEALTGQLDIGRRKRAEFTGTLLRILSAGWNPVSFPFLDPPSVELVQDAMNILSWMGAMKDGELTDLGKEMARIQTTPQAGALIGAKASGCFDQVAALVALSPKKDDLWLSATTDRDKEREARRIKEYVNRAPTGDHLMVLLILQDFYKQGGAQQALERAVTAWC
ncbi:hypothetical protein HDU88_005965 [Geranomyces variabilis]|nr:hypothetical protein HDU88_005965 [Geranomyces variabilis]